MNAGIRVHEVMERVPVALGERSYEIRIGTGLIDSLAAHLDDILERPRTAVVTDEQVGGLYLGPVLASLKEAGIDPVAITVPPGEASKSWPVLQSLVSDLLAAGIERRDCVLALGGGVVGDLAGFAAAILRRGVDVVQIPTTLLAQVDSSVGGKTGLNVPEGKNLVGAFHQPRRVLIDLATLDSLPERELCAGYAEVVKYGLIDRPDFFDRLERDGVRVLGRDRDALCHAIATSCRAKAMAVAHDERESGSRALLNLGHTFAHALEAARGYDGTLLHGEAVAIGMLLAFDLSVRLGHAPARDAERVRRHLANIGLPTAIRDLGPPLAAKKLASLMRQDKKVRDGRPVFVLVHGIGKAFLSGDVPDEALLATLGGAPA